MTDYSELVKALTCGNDGKLPCHNNECPYWVDKWHGIGLCNVIKKDADAAAAIEALQAEVERLTKENKELAADRPEMEEVNGHWEWRKPNGEQLLPKQGEIVRCGECAHCYAEGFAHERNICEKHPELGNVPDDWFCADGEREVQE